MDSLKPRLNLFEIKQKRAAGKLARPMKEFGISILSNAMEKTSSVPAFLSLSCMRHPQVEVNLELVL
jgi:hypothetical protein